MAHQRGFQSTFFDEQANSQLELLDLPAREQQDPKKRFLIEYPTNRSQFGQSFNFQQTASELTLPSSQGVVSFAEELGTSGISASFHVKFNSSEPVVDPVTYLKIEASTYLICNNKLRCFLESQFQTAKLLFYKKGLKMKFFKTAIAKLKRPISSQDLPLKLKFEGIRLLAYAGDEQTFRDFLIESDRKVFIRGLTPYSSESDLKCYLEKFGELQYIQMTPNKQNRYCQCAIAIFASHQSMLAVLECKSHLLNNRKIDISRYINRTFTKRRKDAGSLDSENTGPIIINKVEKEDNHPNKKFRKPAYLRNRPLDVTEDNYRFNIARTSAALEAVNKMLKERVEGTLLA
jgi:RNA recognition motif. (a.k.a. RRM, RBD, or RNP domain)